jgi:hypothetical protein
MKEISYHRKKTSSNCLLLVHVVEAAVVAGVVIS